MKHYYLHSAAGKQAENSKVGKSRCSHLSLSLTLPAGARSQDLHMKKKAPFGAHISCKRGGR